MQTLDFSFTIPIQDTNVQAVQAVQAVDQNTILLNLSQGIILTIFEDHIKIQNYDGIEIPHTRIVDNKIIMAYSYGSVQFNDVHINGNKTTNSFLVKVKHFEFNIYHVNNIYKTYTINVQGFNLVKTNNEIKIENESNIIEINTVPPLLNYNEYCLDVLDGIKMVIENDKLKITKRDPTDMSGAFINYAIYTIIEDKFANSTSLKYISVKGDVQSRSFIINIKDETFRIYHKSGENYSLVIPLDNHNIIY